MNTNEINVLVLAYLGDTIYEDYIRKYLIIKGFSNVNDLQKEAVNFVSAKAQAKFLTELMAQNYFSNIELGVIKRARNHKGGSHPKSCDVITYKYATGLEALIGYLELNNNRNRIDEIMKEIFSLC